MITRRMAQADQMKPEPRSPSSLRFGRVALAVSSVAGILLCALIAWPFLGAITWALTLAILFAPLHASVERRVRHPNIAALLSMVLSRFGAAPLIA